MEKMANKYIHKCLEPKNLEYKKLLFCFFKSTNLKGGIVAREY